VLEDGELETDSTVSILEIVQKEGKILKRDCPEIQNS
jgi:hypothetical protein